MSSKVVNWAEAEDDDFLPPSTVEGPDEKGIKIITEYKKNDLGLKVKITKKVKVVTRRRKISRQINERKQWPKFGAAVDDKEGMTTFVSNDEVRMETPEDEANKADAGLDILETIKAGLLKKEMKRRLGNQGITLGDDATDAPRGLRTGTELSRGESGLAQPGGEGKYLPPGARGMAGSRSQWGQDRDESNTLRVTNISEDTTERDLQELFRPFGSVSRIYLAKDRETGASRGFAYVSYVRREDAEKAKEKLDGFGYDYLILKVEWAKPSSREDVGSQNVMKYASGYGKSLPQGKGE